jgi:hypothetical protein
MCVGETRNSVTHCTKQNGVKFGDNRQTHITFKYKLECDMGQSMLYSEIIAVCSQIHTQQINTNALTDWFL